jgi:nucleotide-binding universal stress UspA family protein
MSEKQRGPILVGLDGSENSAAALRWAIQEAKAVNAEVVAVHAFHLAYYPIADPSQQDAVIPVPRGATAYPQVVPAAEEGPQDVTAEVAALEHSLRENARDAFRTGWLAPLEQSGVRYREVFEEGRPGPVLLEVAAREQIDLIVVGRRGLGSVRELLLGSVSHYLAHHSDRPVVILPPASEKS